MRFFIFFLNAFWLWGQIPFFTLDPNAYLGTQFSAALGLQQQAYWSIGSERSLWQETSVHTQNINFATPTQGDRWTWSAQLLTEQGYTQNLQQLAVGWCFRLPLEHQRQIFLGTRLMGRNLKYNFDHLQHIVRPDPLLYPHQNFRLNYGTSLAFQSKQGYFLLAYNDLVLSSSSESLLFRSPKQLSALMGYEFNWETLGQVNAIVGLKNKDKLATYYGLLAYTFPWDTSIIIYADNELTWSLRWQQLINRKWTVGFAYGQGARQTGERRYGFSLTYDWEPFFDQDQPVESLDYNFND